MIEREFVEQKKKEFQIQEFVSETLKNAGHSHTKLQRTPLGEKVIIYTSRPGLIVGRKGQTISKLTEVLKKKFGLENPQVEIAEVSNPNLDSRIVAERIAAELERFGANRFKGIMHKTSEDVLAAGAMGVEIRLSGKLPGARAKSWRVAGGYLRKCGDAAMACVNKTIFTAQLKPGIIGIQVRIMPSGISMPDEMKFIESEETAKEDTGTGADAAVPPATPEKTEVAPEGATATVAVAAEPGKDEPLKTKPKRKRASAQKVKSVKEEESAESKVNIENESSEGT
ncbi:TPA: 30S ribosomal protein S3 [Candidatus Woesearchaeota archaeon]|nr:30S ribosomal protein S3 [uncultured archaeon]HIG98293.1 30S ribosomal protein S3 [Candidatus Woesearchaeota archaeon]